MTFNITAQFLCSSLTASLIFAISSGLTACQKPDIKADTANPASAISATHTHTHTHTMPASAGGEMAGMDHNKMKHGLPMDTSKPAPASSESVYLVGGNWRDQTGKSFDLNSLQGKKQVVAMVYTSCQQVCPFIMKGMQKIQSSLPADIRSHTDFLVISLDPKRDTPSVLANFAEHYRTDSQWKYLNGNDNDIRMIANTMNIRYQFTDSGEINHSNVISVLDETGKMVLQVVDTAAGEQQIIDYLTKGSLASAASATPTTTKPAV